LIELSEGGSWDVTIVALEHETSPGWCEIQSAGVSWQAASQICWSLPYTLADGIQGALYKWFFTVLYDSM